MMPETGKRLGGTFATTRWSQVLGAGQDDHGGRACLDALCRAYWEPLRRHAERRGWRDAEDAVQDFWMQMISRGSIGTADRNRGRFRTWLLACLDHHLADRRAALGAAKRGSGKNAVPLNELLHGSDAEDPALGFDSAWAETLLARVREHLQLEAGEAGRRRYACLERFLEDNGSSASYADAGKELGMSEGAVKVAVHRLRQRFRERLREEVADTLQEPTPALIDEELGHLCEALAARNRAGPSA